MNRKPNAKETQLIIEREKWPRYHAANGGGVTASKAGTPKAQRQSALRAIKEDFERKHPEAQRVATPAEPGPLTRQAKELAETLRRLKVTEATRQANGGDIAEANGIHKLPRHIIGG